MEKKRILGVRWSTTLHTAVSVSRTSGAPDPTSVSHSNQRRVWPRIKRPVQKSNVAVDVCQVSSFFGPQPAGFVQRKREGEVAHINVKRLNLEWIDWVILKEQEQTVNGPLTKLHIKLHSFTVRLVWWRSLDNSKILKSGNGMYDYNESRTVLTFTRAKSKILKWRRLFISLNTVLCSVPCS